MEYTAVLAFNRMLTQVALVRKQKGPPALKGRWNGIGGKIEIGESPVGAAVREFKEETGICITKDDLVSVEHQYFPTGDHNKDHVYWYATMIDTLHRRLPTHNDADEPLAVIRVDDLFDYVLGDQLCPNVEYLIPKALVYLKTDYLNRPWSV